MFECFYPGEYLDSTYEINFEKLFREGDRGVIFDIDNTLVPHGAPADDRAKALFARLGELGFRCCLLSNNKEGRVKMFNEEIGAYYIYDAHKPSVKNYRAAMEQKLRTGGYQVFLALDTSIQQAVEDTLYNWKNYPSLRDPADSVYRARNAAKKCGPKT